MIAAVLTLSACVLVAIPAIVALTHWGLKQSDERTNVAGLLGQSKALNDEQAVRIAELEDANRSLTGQLKDTQEALNRANQEATDAVVKRIKEDPDVDAATAARLLGSLLAQMPHG